MIIPIFATGQNIVIMLNKGALICKINKRESIICKNKIYLQKDNSNYFQTPLLIYNSKSSWIMEIVQCQLIWTLKMFPLFLNNITVNILIINNLHIKLKRIKKI